MKAAVRQLAETVAEMYVAKFERGYAPRTELEKFSVLLTSVDWRGELMIPRRTALFLAFATYLPHSPQRTQGEIVRYWTR